MSYRHVDLISLSKLHNWSVAPIDPASCDLTTLGGRVAFLRLMKGWPGAELGRRCGYSQNAIWNLESGKTAEPTARLLWAVADALETTPEYLWTGEYDPSEAALIAAFRLLPPEQRPAVLRAAGVNLPGPDDSAKRHKH